MFLRVICYVLMTVVIPDWTRSRITVGKCLDKVQQQAMLLRDVLCTSVLEGKLARERPKMHQAAPARERCRRGLAREEWDRAQGAAGPAVKLSSG